MKPKKKNTSFYIFGYLLEKNVEIWKFFLSFSLADSGYWNSEKALDFLAILILI
jgi:hypothetical protein